MRLWHEALIPYLPRQQLLGQHRECCALRGNGWGRKHATVNYVFDHPFAWLVLYHFKVMDEMERRGYTVDGAWRISGYRGQKADLITSYASAFIWQEAVDHRKHCSLNSCTIYPEHDEKYLAECIENLKKKGIEIKLPLYNSIFSRYN